MASLRKCARYVQEEAADGICWIALWKEGRSCLESRASLARGYAIQSRGYGSIRR